MRDRCPHSFPFLKNILGGNPIKSNPENQINSQCRPLWQQENQHLEEIKECLWHYHFLFFATALPVVSATTNCAVT